METANREILLVNQKFCDLFQIHASPLSLVGVDCANAADQVKHLFSNPTAFVEEVELLQKTKKKQLGRPVHLANGKVLSRDFIPLFEGEKFIGQIWSYTDITDSFNSEQKALLNQKEFLEEILNQVPFEIAVLDSDSNYLFVNPSFIGVAEIRKWVVGKSDKELIEKLQFPSSLISLRKANFLKAVYSKEQVEFHETVLSEQGKQLYFIRRFFPVLNQDKEVVQVIAFGQDITSVVEAEKKLTSAKLQAEETAQLKESFLTKVSHEIRTPMNGIMGIIDVLSRTTLNEQQKKYASVLKESSLNLLNIVNDVLDIGKMAAGKMSVEKSSFNLIEKVRILETVYAPEAEKKGLIFKLNFQQPLSEYFIGDYNRISQVLGNLLSNAIKFTDAGYIELNVSQTELEPSIALLHFDVVDTGKGIDKPLLQTVFEPYSQLFASENGISQGTGLGLTICKDIAQLMNGKLTVESNLGKGSAFSFSIPLSIDNKYNGLSKNYSSDTSVVFANKKFLLVEDMELNQFVINEMMSETGAILDIANNGKEALELCQNNIYDLILMDIQMPVMDGVEATKQIRKLKNGNEIKPIVALSANAFPADKIRYINAGMNGILVKPINLDVLIEVASNCFDGKLIDLSSEEKQIEKAMEHVNIDLSYLMRVGGNKPEFVNKMLQSFSVSTNEIVENFEQAIKLLDWEKAASLAHKMKFSLGVLGIKSLDEQINWLETNARKLKGTESSEYLIQATAMNNTVRNIIAEAKKLAE
jgi:signal transduction histidine kinase/DNA-binding NarL/FixJ family response regulator